MKKILDSIEAAGFKAMWWAVAVAMLYYFVDSGAAEVATYITHKIAVIPNAADVVAVFTCVYFCIVYTLVKTKK